MFKLFHHFFSRHYRARYHGVYQHAKQLFIFDLMLLGFSVLLLSASIFFFLWKPGLAKLVEIKLSLGDNRLLSGEMAALSVRFTNHSEQTLESPSLSLRLPPGFVLLNAPPSFASNTQTVTLPSLKPGANGQAEFVGRFWATPNQEERFTATLNFNNQKSQSEHASGVLIATLPESIISAKISAPISTVIKQPLPISLTLNNALDLATPPVSITCSNEISFAGPTKGIIIPPRSQVTLSGLWPAPDLAASILLTCTPEIIANNQIIKLSAVTQKIAVADPGIAIVARLPTSVKFVTAGLTLPITIVWQKGPQPTLKNQRLRLLFANPAGLVDLPGTARAERLKLDGNSLIINAETRTALAGTNAATDEFIINLKLEANFLALPETTSALLFTPIFEAETIAGQAIAYRGAEVSAPLQTELSLLVEPRYFTDEGDQLGRGPVPPRVGLTTKYWILVAIKNTTNPVEDVRLETTLPPQVIFTGQQSVTIGERLRLDSATRRLSWQTTELPAHSAAGLYFEVAVTPTQDNVGKPIPLLGESALVGTDTATKQTSAVTQEALLNVLPPSDKAARGGGAVRAK